MVHQQCTVRQQAWYVSARQKCTVRQQYDYSARYLTNSMHDMSAN